MSSKPTCIKSGSTANLQFEAELYAHDPWKVLFLGFKPNSGVAGNQDVWYKITNLKYELKKEKPVYTTMATGFQEVTNSGYRYGFQGQERDNEWKGAGNSYTTLWRQYDPRLGRWLTLDPKANELPWQSLYCGMDNNPILYADPFGDKVKAKLGRSLRKELGISRKEAKNHTPSMIQDVFNKEYGIKV